MVLGIKKAAHLDLLDIVLARREVRSRGSHIVVLIPAAAVVHRALVLQVRYAPAGVYRITFREAVYRSMTRR